MKSSQRETERGENNQLLRTIQSGTRFSVCPGDSEHLEVIVYYTQHICWHSNVYNVMSHSVLYLIQTFLLSLAVVKGLLKIEENVQ